MKSDFKLQNLLGTVYREGNLVFTEDGTKLLSPVGNRVSCFDLINNKSFTFNYQHRKNVSRIALNKQGTLMITVDDNGRAILVNFVSRVVLHHFNFKGIVYDIKFSNDGHYFAVAVDRFVQIWKTPDFSEDRQFAPFVRHRNYAGHYNDVLSVTWSADLRFLVSTSKDLTSRIFSLHSEDKDAAMTLTGHRNYVVKAFFNSTQEIIYTISRDGALNQYEYIKIPGENSDSDSESSDSEGDEENDEEKDSKMQWTITSKNFFHLEGTRVKCADFHAPSNILVVGFTNGEFRLYELPEFNLIQQLSMGQNAVNTVTMNKTGEWLAFGLAKAGQLLVYEWQSELYVLKQQGHFDAMNCVCYSPDGSRAVTASDDGKVKVWDVSSGFCLMTFTEHTGPVSAVQFAKKGQVVFSASGDGTVRAWDLIRFRNFRTFTARERVQFTSLAVDPSGEVVVAGSQDEFEIFVWSVQTGTLLDSLAGHEGPISSLAFGSELSNLASTSWDKTLRIWSIFNRTQLLEPIDVGHDVLAIAMRPDSKEVAVSTLSGYILVFDVEQAKEVHSIDIRKDVFAGRFLTDRFELGNSARAKSFTTLAYSFDGSVLVAGGNNNSICLYDVADEVLLRRFIVSENMSLDGTLTQLNSSKITDAGTSIDLVDDQGEASDKEERRDFSLPGSHRGDPSARRIRPQVRVTGVQFSPTAGSFAAATTEGLLVYGTDGTVEFDPFDLDVDVTPDAVAEALGDGEWMYALVMAFRLNEHHLLQRVVEHVPVQDIPLVCQDLPSVYVVKLLEFLGKVLNGESGHHVEFLLLWVRALLNSHGRYLSTHKAESTVAMRLVQRFLARVAKDVVAVSKTSGYAFEYLCTARRIEGESMDVDGDVEEGTIELEPEHEKDEIKLESDGESEEEADSGDEAEEWKGFGVKKRSDKFA